MLSQRIRAAHAVRVVRVVRPSLRDPLFGLLVAAEAINSVGGWASGIVLWGLVAYRFDAGRTPSR